MSTGVIEIDIRSGDVPSVRVNFNFGDNEPREYKNCYAWYTNGLVYIVHYQDHPSMIPRAVFNADHIFVEHFGPHPHPPNQRRRAPRAGEAKDSVLDMAKLEEWAKTPQQPAGAPTGDMVALPVKETSAVLAGGPEAAAQLHEGRDVDEILDEHVKKFEELTTPQTSLPADPKDDAEPSTEETFGSDPNMVETPSGKFRTSPLPEEEAEPLAPWEKELLEPEPGKTGQTGSWQPSRERGSHKRKSPAKLARKMPGTTALFVMALFLGLSFRQSR